MGLVLGLLRKVFRGGPHGFFEEFELLEWMWRVGFEVGGGFESVKKVSVMSLDSLSPFFLENVVIRNVGIVFLLHRLLGEDHRSVVRDREVPGKGGAKEDVVNLFKWVVVGVKSVQSGSREGVLVGEFPLVNRLKLMWDCELFVEVGRFEFVFVTRGLHRLEVDPVCFMFRKVEAAQ